MLGHLQLLSFVSKGLVVRIESGRDILENTSAIEEHVTVLFKHISIGTLNGELPLAFVFLPDRAFHSVAKLDLLHQIVLIHNTSEILPNLMS